MPLVRLGLIGCGGRLRFVLKNLLKAGGSQLRVTALYDPLKVSRDALRIELSLEARELPSAQAVCEAPDVDWVMIGSWNCFHAEQVLAAFRAGKHVFCEKPLAISPEDCLALREAWRKSQRTFFFGLVLRYSPIYRKVKELVDAGRLGSLVSVEFNETLPFNHGGYIHGNWRRYRGNAGTHLLEKCCHDLDIMNWLSGSLPVRAASFGGHDFFLPRNREWARSLGTDEAGRRAYETWPDPERVDPFSEGATIVDNQVAILEYAQGFRATFHTNCNAALPERRVYLLGSHGAIRADVLTRRIQHQAIGFHTQTEEIAITVASGDHFGGDEHMATALSRSMLDGIPPLASMDEALRSALTAFAIDEAMDTGTIVDIRSRWNEAAIIP